MEYWPAICRFHKLVCLFITWTRIEFWCCIVIFSTALRVSWVQHLQETLCLAQQWNKAGLYKYIWLQGEINEKRHVFVGMPMRKLCVGAHLTFWPISPIPFSSSLLLTKASFGAQKIQWDTVIPRSEIWNATCTSWSWACGRCPQLPPVWLWYLFSSPLGCSDQLFLFLQWVLVSVLSLTPRSRVFASVSSVECFIRLPMKALWKEANPRSTVPYLQRNQTKQDSEDQAVEATRLFDPVK